MIDLKNPDYLMQLLKRAETEYGAVVFGNFALEEHAKRVEGERDAFMQAHNDALAEVGALRGKVERLLEDNQRMAERLEPRHVVTRKKRRV